MHQAVYQHKCRTPTNRSVHRWRVGGHIHRHMSSAAMSKRARRSSSRNPALGVYRYTAGRHVHQGVHKGRSWYSTHRTVHRWRLGGHIRI